MSRVANNTLSSQSGFSALQALRSLKSKQNACLRVLPDVHFNGMEQNEKVVLLIRSNKLFLVIKMILTVITAIMAYFLFGYALSLLYRSMGLSVSMMYLKLLIITIGGTLFMLVTDFIRWYFNLFLISTNRILDLDLYTMAAASWTTARLENIEDVEVKNKGFIQMLLGVGDVYIQTAGKEAKIELRNINYPLEIQDIIMDFSEMRKQQSKFRVATQ